MTTDCSATTSPTRLGAWGRPVAGSAADVGDGDAPACAKQAATRARKARNLIAVVASWNRLLRRRPAHCKVPKKTSTATATSLTAGLRDGIRTAVNSPIA